MTLVLLPSIHIAESFLILHGPESLYQTFRFDTLITYVDISKLTVDKTFEHIIRAKGNKYLLELIN